MTEGLSRQLELLCRISVEDHSLRELVNIAYELFENPVHITDMSRTVLAYTNCVSFDDETWLRNVVSNERMTETPGQIREVRRIHNESIQSRMPTIIEPDVAPFPCIIKTLLNTGGHPIGVVVLSGINRPLTSVDARILELLSTYLVQQMEKEHFVLRTNERQAENFVIKLLDGTVDSEKHVQGWLNYLDWHPKAVRYVVVFQEDDSAEEPETLENVLQVLHQLPYCRVVIYDNRIVLVYSRETSIGDWADDEPMLLDYARQWHMIMGVSREVSMLSNLREAYLEARTALRLARSIGSISRLCEYSSYSFYHLLETVPKGVSLRRFCNDKVLRLERQDKSVDKELMNTLLNYLNNGRSLTKTAEMMFIHRNTVRYRINKCMEIMQTDFEFGDEIFDIIFSLRILTAYRCTNSTEK